MIPRRPVSCLPRAGGALGSAAGRAFALAAALLVYALAACRSAAPVGTASMPSGAAAEPPEARIRRDPLAYLHVVREKCRALRQYTCTLIRQERRGLVPTLQPSEEVLCWFRRDPLAIRMKWTDPNGRFGESTYVEGWAGNMLRFVPRRGLFGLPPGVTTVGVQVPVVWGETKYPVTDFGPEQLMVQTLRSIEEAQGDVTISYRGLATLPEHDAPLHRIDITYNPRRKTVPIQELYVDPATDIPIATTLRLEDGSLDAAYFYLKLNRDVELTDEEFLLDHDRASGVTPEELRRQRPATAPTSEPANSPTTDAPARDREPAEKAVRLGARRDEVPLPLRASKRHPRANLH